MRSCDSSTALRADVGGDIRLAAGLLKGLLPKFGTAEVLLRRDTSGARVGVVCSAGARDGATEEMDLGALTLRWCSTARWSLTALAVAAGDSVAAASVLRLPGVPKVIGLEFTVPEADVWLWDKLVVV